MNDLSEILEFKKELEVYLKTEDKDINEIVRDDRNFRIQLMIIASGVISVFSALQKTDEAMPPIMLTGYSLLGVSIIFGVGTFLLGNVARHFMFYSNKLGMINSFLIKAKYLETKYKQDLEIEKGVLRKYAKAVIDITDNRFKKTNLITGIIKLTKIDNQIIENIQILLFVLGVILIVISLFN